MSLEDHVVERAQARVGTVLRDKWTLDSVLGIGGMATVYAATHRNQSRVAIKILHAEVAMDREVTQRFLREGYLANTVGHPGTVKVLDDDKTPDGAAFLVMELLEGETVEARWARKGERLPLEEALGIGDQLLAVLDAAHGRGIVHRDLKPENLFLTTEGRLKVLDFGIARLREVSQHRQATTRAGSLLGTPAFMAPEQARGRWDEVDHRTDLWAAAATLYTLVTGRFVHEADTLNEQLIAAATKPARPLAEALVDAPAAVAAVIDRGLSFEKSARWPSACEFRRALREAQGLVDEEAPLTLAAPRPSIVQTPETQPTLVAPSSGSGHLLAPRAETVTTARPITTSAGEAPASPLRRRAAVTLGLGALLVTGLSALLLAGGERHRGAPAAVPEPPGMSGQGPPSLAPAATEPRPPSAPTATSSEGAVMAAPDASAAPPSSSARPARHGPIRPVVVAAPSTRPPVGHPPPVVTSPPVGANPFDRRH